MLKHLGLEWHCCKIHVVAKLNSTGGDKTGIPSTSTPEDYQCQYKAFYQMNPRNHMQIEPLLEEQCFHCVFNPHKASGEESSH